MEADDRLLEALIQLVLLSMFIERCLAFFFDWKRIAAKLDGKDVKPLIALVMSVGFCFAYDFNVIGALFPKVTITPGSGKYYLSIGLTGLVVAGGSAGAIKLFQDVLGFNRQSRDAIREAKLAEAEAKKAEAAQRSAEAEARKAESQQKRVESEAVTAQVTRAMKAAETK